MQALFGASPGRDMASPLQLHASAQTVQSSSPTLKDSIDPIGYTKIGNLLEISKICREKECAMNEGNRCNLEVHRPNADALGAQALPYAGSLLIKRHDVPARKEVTQP